MLGDENAFKKWVLDRSNYRSSVTKFFVGYSKPSELSKAQANVQKCENCIARLKDLDDLILSYKVNHDMITDEQYAKEYQECKSYQDQLVQLLHTAKGHVAELQPLSPMVESSPHQTRLPYWKLELLVFDGRPESYSRFILQFEKITQQMKVDDFGKYTLLHHHLQGEAKLLVSSILVGNKSYNYAKKLLYKVYLIKGLSNLQY